MNNALLTISKDEQFEFTGTHIDLKQQQEDYFRFYLMKPPRYSVRTMLKFIENNTQKMFDLRKQWESNPIDMSKKDISLMKFYETKLKRYNRDILKIKEFMQFKQQAIKDYREKLKSYDGVIIEDI